MRNALIALIAFVVIAMIYRLVKMEEMSWEFWALIGTAFAVVISRRIYGDIEEPKDAFGKPLPLGHSKEDKRVRKKGYAVNSLIFAGTCAVMDVILIAVGKDDITDAELSEFLFPSLDPMVPIAVTAVITLVVTFAVSYLFEWFVGEKLEVKRYNEELQRLDSESDDLD